MRNWKRGKKVEKLIVKNGTVVELRHIGNGKVKEKELPRLETYPRWMWDTVEREGAQTILWVDEMLLVEWPEGQEVPKALITDLKKTHAKSRMGYMWAKANGWRKKWKRFIAVARLGGDERLKEKLRGKRDKFWAQEFEGRVRIVLWMDDCHRQGTLETWLKK